MSDLHEQALHNARTSPSMANYAAIFQGFATIGIAQSDIKPRENVFTFNAWRALGRTVKKGEHGVTVHTWVPMSKKDENGEAHSIGRKPRTTTVFHVSQTEAREGYSDALWQYALDHPMDAGIGESQYTEMRAAPVVKDNAQAEYYSTEFTQL